MVGTRASAVARACLTLACALVALCTTARAQELPRLTVDTFTLGTDTSTPNLQQPFHLIVTVHVRERVERLDRITLPILKDLELLGDERKVVADRGGTTYRETIEVVATHTGEIRIDPATLDAIDARDGKGKRYFSNPLVLHVGGGELESPWPGMFIAVRNAAFVAIGVGAVILLGALFFRRKPAPTPPPREPTQVLPRATPVARDPRAELRDGLTVLRAHPTRSNVLAVRHVVRRMVGASDVETLADVLHRPPVATLRVREILIALERAAFTYDADLNGAVELAIAALERALA